MRTTCVATRLAAGHANNALPQTATANVNCRIFPGHSREEIRHELVKIVADPKVTVGYVQIDGSIAPTAPSEQQLPPVTLRDDVMKPLREISAEFWPGMPIVPEHGHRGFRQQVRLRGRHAFVWNTGRRPGQQRHSCSRKDERLPVESFKPECSSTIAF